MVDVVSEVLQLYVLNGLLKARVRLPPGQKEKELAVVVIFVSGAVETVMVLLV
jgi:hypothetical protein